MSLGFAVVQLDVSVVNVALKAIGAGLGGGVGALQWVVSAYTLAFASLILTAGALGDRLGAKRMFVGGFAIFTAASALCALAPSLPVLIAGRALQGTGAAVLVPCSLSLLGHAFAEGPERARAVGLWAAGASAALSAGPLVGGVLTTAVGWRSIFALNLPLGLTGIVLTARYASETTRSRARGIDGWGQLTAVVALLAVAAATIEGGTHGFTDGPVLAGYAVAALAGASFVAVERRRAQPMLPLGLFRRRAFSAASSIGLVINVAFYGLIFVLSLFFQRSQHLSPLETGLAFAPMTLAVMGANLLAGRLASRFSPPRVAAAGALTMAAACAGLLTMGEQSPYPELVVQLLALGGGIGLVVPVMTTALLGSVERGRSGVASGTLNTARQAGSVLGVALFGSLIARGPLVGGLHVALAIALALSLAAGLLSPGLRGP